MIQALVVSLDIVFSPSWLTKLKSIFQQNNNQPFAKQIGRDIVCRKSYRDLLQLVIIHGSK